MLDGVKWIKHDQATAVMRCFVTLYFSFFFCKAQAMIAERKILLCKLLSSGESETIEIKPCSTIVYILGVSGKRFISA